MTCPITLRDYQETGVEQIRAAFSQGVPRVLYQCPTGGGKTVLFCYIALQAHQRGNRVWIVVHRRELVKQTVNKLREFGVPCGVMASGWTPNSYQPVQVCLIDSMPSRMRNYPEPQLIIEDECFPAGTLIDGRPIESLEVGDTVSSFNHKTGQIEQRPILHKFISPVKSLVKIRFQDGNSLICTANHPVFTLRGYVPAGIITSSDMVLTTTPQQGVNGSAQLQLCCMQHSVLEEVMEFQDGTDLLAGVSCCAQAGAGEKGNYELPNLPEGSFTSRQKWTHQGAAGRNGLLDGMQEHTEFSHSVKNQQTVCVRANDEKEPNAQRGDTSEGIDAITRDGLEATSSRRQRGIHNSAKTDCVRAGLGYGGGNSDAYEARQRISPELQGGCGEFGSKDCRGGGRFFTHGVQSESRGQEEGRALSFVGVDCVEVLESSNIRRPDGVCPDGLVYNIEVEHNNNYFAEGVLVHNCHHVVSPKWLKVLTAITHAKHLGVTATPERLDGKGLGDFYEALILGPSVRELIAKGALCRSEIWSWDTADLKAVHTVAGDFNKKELGEAMDKKQIIGKAVEHYRDCANGTPAIAFCVNLDHAEHVAQQFRDAGYNALRVDGKMEQDERDKAIKGLGDGSVQILTSCDLISEGVDIPVVSTAILLRPTKSLSLYLQQVGRVLRPADGKPHANILDHAGNVVRHMPPDWPREWSLTGTKRRGEAGQAPAMVTQCSACYRVYEGRGQCPYCLFTPVAQGRELNEVDGALVKFTDEMARKAEAEQKKREVWGASTRADLDRIAGERNYSPGWVRMQLQLRKRYGRPLKEEAAVA